MAYKIVVSNRAIKEIEDAIDFYSEYSSKAPALFIAMLQDAYQKLNKNPLTRVYYKQVRGFKLKRFPYILYFSIDEMAQTVKILACFHSKRNPERRP